MRRQKITLILLILGLGIMAMPPVTSAQTYRPPDRGLPGRREGGGTRGNCVMGRPTLTALMPEANFGQTTQAYPTLFWYIPATKAVAAEFELLDQNNQQIYITEVSLPDRPGVLSISLPKPESLPEGSSQEALPQETLPQEALPKQNLLNQDNSQGNSQNNSQDNSQDNSAGLVTGQTYRWYFSLICDRDDRSGDVITEGWIERREADADLAQRLEQATPEERVVLYAEAGIWHDALNQLMELRTAQPDNPVLLRQWRYLLTSVNLAELAQQPLRSRPSANP